MQEKAWISLHHYTALVNRFANVCECWFSHSDVLFVYSHRQISWSLSKCFLPHLLYLFVFCEFMSSLAICLAQNEKADVFMHVSPCLILARAFVCEKYRISAWRPIFFVFNKMKRWRTLSQLWSFHTIISVPRKCLHIHKPSHLRLDHLPFWCIIYGPADGEEGCRRGGLKRKSLKVVRV